MSTLTRALGNRCGWRQVGAVIVLVAALVLPSQTAGASLEDHWTLRVEAFIDGRSQLVINSNNVWWQHLDYAAPGRHTPYDYPTLLNGREWYPEWPDLPSPENRWCDCVSSVYPTLSPELPTANGFAIVTPISTRGSVYLVDSPSAANGFSLTVEFNDDPQPGPAWYVVEISFETCTMTGTEGDDVLYGSWGRDVICGLGGHDVIFALTGDDRIVGGPGDDRIHGGSGNDWIRGEEGDDTIWAGAGDDDVKPGPGHDAVYGMWGNDSLWARDSASDVLDGGPGTDRAQIDAGLDVSSAIESFL